MKFYAPSYYKKFKCIADKCKNNCCVGWEIDIDENTLSLYKSKPDIAEKISFSDTPHFVLKDNGRCPFLDQDNLCKIIKEYGNSALCQICSDHPRFFSYFDSRTEVGIGLACEAAAELIIENDFSLTLISETEEKIKDNIEEEIMLKERALFLSFNFDAFDFYLPNITKAKAYELLFSLERLNEEWKKRIEVLKNDNTPLCTINDNKMLIAKRLTHYFIYRYYHKFSIEFCLFCTCAILALGDDTKNVAREFSAEIEYSDQNCEKIENYLFTI